MGRHLSTTCLQAQRDHSVLLLGKEVSWLPLW